MATVKNGRISKQAIIDQLDNRPIVLVGMMGCGKSSVGRRLAARLGLEFVDADTEIERAAGMSIPDIFERHGEDDFRSGERRVIARLIGEGKLRVIATGGGAFINDETRALIKDKAVSVWLKAEFDVLMQRVRRKADRPMLKTADPEATMRSLLAQRNPVYAKADITVVTEHGPHQKVVGRILSALSRHLKMQTKPEGAKEKTA
ncbi:MAG: shikimate kinase [Rhodobiaceae bacterium]|nr:shikimate kinase [Rhodobiaceae bacterium]